MLSCISQTIPAICTDQEAVADLSDEVDDANDKAVLLCIKTHKQAVVHDSKACQEGSVTPQHSLQASVGSLINLPQADAVVKAALVGCPQAPSEAHGWKWHQDHDKYACTHST